MNIALKSAHRDKKYNIGYVAYNKIIHILVGDE